MQTCTESESEKANDFTSAIFVTKTFLMKTNDTTCGWSQTERLCNLKLVWI